MNEYKIKIENAVLRNPELNFKSEINWELKPSEHWAIIGANGAGKTVFSQVITGKLPLKEGHISYRLDPQRPLYEQIRMASFQDVYSLADYKNMYYQQRWNSSDEEDIPVVRDLVKNNTDEAKIEQLFSLFGIKELLDKRLVMLSSGELRKFLIVRILLSDPNILILDNPYIGLDAPSRAMLNNLLHHISVERGVQIVLILSCLSDIPEMVTHVLPIHQQRCLHPYTRGQFLSDITLHNLLFDESEIADLPESSYVSVDYENALEMKKIHIQYGNRIILSDLNWAVKRGEKWALLGPNGAGKSTLLSLVCADNPQGYANTFDLFGRKRGSGESIWEIKKRIGYVSPEIHLYYRQNQSTVQIVGSGFYDSIGLHQNCSDKQLMIAENWMKVFGIEHLKDKPFMHLSFGEQRLAILARAFVKDPELLILDEPLHGLDQANKALAQKIIESFCSRKNKTLIYVTHYTQEIPSCVEHHLRLTKST